MHQRLKWVVLFIANDGDAIHKFNIVHLKLFVLLELPDELNELVVSILIACDMLQDL